MTNVLLLFIRKLAWLMVLPASLTALPLALTARLRKLNRRDEKRKPRLFWGSVPILSNKYWSIAMRRAGYQSETFTTDFYSSINERSDWDRLLSEQYRFAPAPLRPYMGFLRVLWSYDVVFISFQGAFVGNTAMRRLQAFFLKLAGLKIVVIPYGADSYAYRNVRSTSLIHGLLASYPLAARRQTEIATDVDYWCKHADALIPGFMGVDGFGRWDVLLPSQIFIDTELWSPSVRRPTADGVVSEVVVVHAPNHRGFKGSEFVVAAVDALRSEGLKVRLLLLERMQNAEVRKLLREEADILVEQLIFTGHALNGLEGLASGLPVISNLEDEQYVTPFRRWSYFSECPIVSSSPETLVHVLRKLITRPELRRILGEAGRLYVDKYHGLDSAAFLFTNVLEYIYGRRGSLINLYHPLLGEFARRLPRVEHPLVNSRIVD